MRSCDWPNFQVRTATLSIEQIVRIREIIWEEGQSHPLGLRDKWFYVKDHGAMVGTRSTRSPDLPQLNARTVKRIFNL